LSLSNFIKRLEAAGQHDSTGSFTISLAQAREKLRAYQFSQPYLYLCLLASGAFGSGATTVSIERNGAGLSIHASGAYQPPDRFLGAMDQVASLQGDDSVRDLIMGLLGAAHSGCEVFIEFHGTEEDGGSYSLLDSGVEPLEAGESRRLEVVLKPSAAAVADWASTALDLVRDKGRFALRPLAIEGQVFEEDPYLPGARVYGEMGMFSRSRVRSAIVARWPEAPFPGVLAFVGGLVTPIVNQLVYPPFSHPYLTGMIWVDSLQRDLSREQILQNHCYSAVVRTLDDMLQRMERYIDFDPARERDDYVSAPPSGPGHPRIVPDACMQMGPLMDPAKQNPDFPYF
jgi:hypothetical protein